MGTLVNKFLAQSGVCSRRKADDLIKSQRVTVNNKVVVTPYHVVEEGDKVAVDGREVAPEDKVYILLNKPEGYITTVSDERGRKIILELVENATKSRVFPVGRLDKDTTGVIVLTNDGELAQRLSHPSYEVKKVYHIFLDKNLRKKHFSIIKMGFDLNDGFIKVDKIECLRSNKEVSVELHSGRNRIVRRVFEHFGYKVLKLDRVSYAGMNKKNLSRGKWRLLSEEELSGLI